MALPSQPGKSEPIKIKPTTPIIIGPGPPPIQIQPSGLSFDRFRPFYILEEEGLTQGEQTAVVEAVRECLRLAGARGRIRTFGLGVWREPNYFEKGGLVPYKSIDWLIATSPFQLKADLVNAGTILSQVVRTMYEQHQAYYFLLVPRRNLGAPEIWPLKGNTQADTGCVVSSYWFHYGHGRLSEEDRAGCLKTVAIHEVGHLFGLWQRTAGLPSNVGAHCPWENHCVMRAMPTLDQAALVAWRDWQTLGRPFCDNCLANLGNYFPRGEA